MTIRPMQPGEQHQVSHLIWSVFCVFEAPTYSREGVEAFHAWIEPAKLAERFSHPGFFLLCAWEAETLVGVLAVRDYAHIALLFVDASYQRRGIARALVSEALARCREDNPSLLAITVNSSPFAVPIYKRMGFAAIDQEQTIQGIRFTPMRLELKNRS